MSNKRNADASILGFLFQIERALVLLSSMPSDAFIGLETDDDIVVRLAAGEGIQNIYEQAKHSRSNSIPFGDKSEDLWKTLFIWCSAIRENKIPIETSHFTFLTNKNIPSGRFVRRLGRIVKTVDEVKEILGELKNKANTLPKTLKKYGDYILCIDDNNLIKLINRIELVDSGYMHNSVEIRKKIYENLRFPEDVPFNVVFESLTGYVLGLLIDKWKNKEQGWIKVSAFNRQYLHVTTSFLKKSFYEKTVDLLPVTTRDINDNMNKLFVNQLKQIECEEDVVMDAIHDYIRAASERSRMADEGQLSDTAFQLYCSDLTNHWNAISRPAFKYPINDDMVRAGYGVYFECLKYKGRINNFEPEQIYTHRGTYHYLSDQAKIGWHPDWKKINSIL